MYMEEKLEELLNLFNNNKDIQTISLLKNKITDKEKNLIMEYRLNPNIENKKKLYENDIIKEYLICENNLNYLIMEINKKFKRRKICQK